MPKNNVNKSVKAANSTKNAPASSSFPTNKFANIIAKSFTDDNIKRELSCLPLKAICDVKKERRKVCRCGGRRGDVCFCLLFLSVMAFFRAQGWFSWRLAFIECIRHIGGEKQSA
jgi:hypothetical protein